MIMKIFNLIIPWYIGCQVSYSVFQYIGDYIAPLLMALENRYRDPAGLSPLPFNICWKSKITLLIFRIQVSAIASI